MPQMHRFSENIYVASSFLLNAALVTPAVGYPGASKDVGEYRRGAAMVDSELGGSLSTLDVKLQDSADDSSFSDVSGGVMAQIAVAAGHTIRLMDIDLAKTRRYIRLYYTGGGGSLAGYASATLFLFQRHNDPPTQDVTAIHV